MFHIYDKDKNNYISLMEFVSVSGRFFKNSFDAKLKIVFDVYDVNSDGLVSANDIRGILSHIPLELIV